MMSANGSDVLVRLPPCLECQPYEIGVGCGQRVLDCPVYEDSVSPCYVSSYGEAASSSTFVESIRRHVLIFTRKSVDHCGFLS